LSRNGRAVRGQFDYARHWSATAAGIPYKHVSRAVHGDSLGVIGIGVATGAEARRTVGRGNATKWIYAGNRVLNYVRLPGSAVGYKQMQGVVNRGTVSCAQKAIIKRVEKVGGAWGVTDHSQDIAFAAAVTHNHIAHLPRVLGQCAARESQ